MSYAKEFFQSLLAQILYTHAHTHTHTHTHTRTHKKETIIFTDTMQLVHTTKLIIAHVRGRIKECGQFADQAIVKTNYIMHISENITSLYSERGQRFVFPFLCSPWTRLRDLDQINLHNYMTSCMTSSKQQTCLTFSEYYITAQ